MSGLICTFAITQRGGVENAFIQHKMTEKLYLDLNIVDHGMSKMKSHLLALALSQA